MAELPPLKVFYTDQARNELERIWEWNATKYNKEHATDYLLFLESCIDSLARNYSAGKRIRHFPTLLQITMKRSRRGEGHVAVYEVDEIAATVTILHIFHTQQDILGRLEDGLPE